MTEYPAITRRKVIGLMGGLAGGLALHGCTSPSPNSTTGKASDSGSGLESVTVGVVPWIGYSPLYVAEAKGFFDGMLVESKTFNANGDNLASFAAGNLTGQAATNPEVVAQAARGVDYRIIMMADSSLGGDGILARNSVQDIADFKGRKVGVDIGGTSYYLLLQVLKEKAGLSVDDIEVVNMAADAAAAAYQAGTIDIAVTYEPFLSTVGEEQADGRVIIDTSDMPTAILDIYLFQADFVEENPDKVQSFVNGILKGKAFIESDSEEAYKIIGDKLEISPEEVEEQLGGVDLTSLEDNQKVLTGEGASQSLSENLMILSEFLVEQDEIEAPLTAEQVSGLIDSSFITAATEAASDADATEVPPTE